MDSSGTPPPLFAPLGRGVRIKELRRHLDFAGLLAAFGPAVHGVASALLPEDSAAAENVTTAVFELFRMRVRSISKRAVAGVWLFQTAVIAARRERRRLKLPLKPATPEQQSIQRLYRLSPKLRTAVVLVELLGADEPKLLKRARRGVSKIQRKVTGNVRSMLAGLLRPIPEPVRLALAEPGPERLLVRQTASAWRWISFRASLKRIAAGLAAAFCVLLLLGGTFAYLATHGYLMPLFLKLGQREMVKEFPQMLIPPSPWPQTAADRALARMDAPRDAADLFGLTNIWPVTLSFTGAEYRHLKPSRVAPVRDIFQGGRIILRNPEAKRSGLAGVLGFDFNWAKAGLTFGGEHLRDVGVRYRGNGTYVNSLYGSKQSLKLDVNKFIKTNRLAGLHELNFLNTIVDYSFLHDTLAQQLFRELGVIGPRTAYAYVTAQIDGRTEPRGLFVAVENIDGDFAQDRFGTKQAPIFKPVTYDLFDDLGDGWEAYEKTYDLKTKASLEQRQRVVDFAKLATHAGDDEFARKLPAYLDLEEFAGFLAGHVLLSSYDGFLVNGQNYYVYLDPRSDKFGFVSWDQDHGWGDFGHVGTTEQRENASIWRPATYDFRFLYRVMAVPAFREIYRRKLETALERSFNKEKLYREIDAVAQRIRPAVAAESAFRLERFDKAVSSDWLPGPRDGAAEGPKAPIHQIKRFIENRAKSVRDQLDGKSEGAELRGFR